MIHFGAIVKDHDYGVITLYGVGRMLARLFSAVLEMTR